MDFLKTALIQFSEKKYSAYVLVLICFLAIRLIAAFTFYNGFILNFPKIAAVINAEGIINKLLLYNPFYTFSICLASLAHPLFLTALIVICIPVIYKKRYKNFTGNLFSKHDKLILFAASFILSWELCTYDYNYFLNSGFYFDRFLLIVMPFFILRFPGLIPVYVAFAYVYRSQFNYPVDGFDLFDKRILFDILVMYVSLAYVKLYFRKTEIPFLYLVLCIIASNYFVSGVSKISMSPHGYEWLLKNDLSNLFLNVHARGWLCNYNNETISGISAFLSEYSMLFQLIILVLEIAGLFLLRNIKLCITLLILLCLMHFGIFLAGSMLFWKWMAIDLFVAIILWRNKDYFENIIFSKKQFLISLLIVFSSVIWLRPYAIGWFDTKANQYFTYEAVDETGKTAEVAKNELNPFHQWFQYDKFSFLVNKNILPISGFGYTGRYNIKIKLDTLSPENLAIFLSEYGRNNYKADKAKQFERFIKTYFNNRNSYKNKSLWTSIRPPHHLNNCVSDGGLNSLGRIKIFRVIYNVTCNTNGRVLPLRKEIVNEISI
jgi:hypothetical protein